MAVHTYNPNTQEAETKELPQVQSQSSYSMYTKATVWVSYCLSLPMYMYTWQIKEENWREN